MAWDDLKILGKILELWLEGMDGFAGHPVPNDSKDYQPNHRKSFEEVHWGVGDVRESVREVSVLVETNSMGIWKWIARRQRNPLRKS